MDTLDLAPEPLDVDPDAPPMPGGGAPAGVVARDRATDVPERAGVSEGGAVLGGTMPPGGAGVSEGGSVSGGTMRPGGAGVTEGTVPALERTIEALLFLSPDPLTVEELAEAALADEAAVAGALDVLAQHHTHGRSGIVLRELAGGYTLASDPSTEQAARRLFSRPRTATLTPAQAETLAIVAYLQPVSRPEITRIRGVSADSAAATLLERGLIEEAGRSQFGAVVYRTTTLFLKLFGLHSLDDLPDVARWDPTPEEQAELRDRLLRAGEARGAGLSPQG